MFRTLLTLVLAITLAFPAHAERDSLKLLAIGNSFSNDATRQLPQVAKAGGKDLLLGRASIGGCSLERHARHLAEARAGDAKGRAYQGFDDPKTGTKRNVTLIEALQSAKWDIVTVQQVSHQSFKRESFQPHLDQLIAAIREHAPSAEIVIHQTWAYREDHPFFQKDDGFTPLKMYEGLTANYRHFAEENNFRILPVGDALHLARQTPRWTYTPDPDFDFANPPAGLHAALPKLSAGTALGEFKIDFTLNGSGRLDFLPLARQTDVQLTSTWADPGFNGAFLPTTRDVSDAGFSAKWSVPYYSREYAQQWSDNSARPGVEGMAFIETVVKSAKAGAKWVKFPKV